MGKLLHKENTKIFSSEDKEIGLVTSGTFGPSVNAPVAMGYVKSNFAKAGTSIKLEVRGKKNTMVKFLNFHFIKKIMLNKKRGNYE